MLESRSWLIVSLYPYPMFAVPYTTRSSTLDFTTVHGWDLLIGQKKIRVNDLMHVQYAFASGLFGLRYFLLGADVSFVLWARY